MNTGFFAYSSWPRTSGESIEEAIKNINARQETNLKSWKSLDISGRFIISAVLKSIDEADYFCADLTGMNDNVLFEIGYAIATDKPIWLIFDNSHTPSKRKFGELNFLTTVGYSAYTNSDKIVAEFFKCKPFELNTKQYERLLGSVKESGIDNIPLLVLKSQYDTDYNQLLLNQAKNEYKLTYVLDDAVETKVQSFSWYLEKLKSIPAVLVEYSSTDRAGYELQNSKCSLISGIAVGLGLRVLMVSEEPYETPLDYRELLKKYNNKTQCKEMISPFLSEIKEEIFTLLAKRVHNQKIKKERSKLEGISFGEYLAEHESNELYDYYVDILNVKDLIKSEYNIVVGRKGSGKTATLLYLKDVLEQDSRNHVCLIKPVSFEIDALLFLLGNLNEDYEKSNLIESAWKLLIYSEIAKSVYQKLKERPLFSLNEIEEEFISFIENNSKLFLEDFSIRLERALKGVSKSEFGKDVSDFKIRVSEIMHEETLGNIKVFFGKLFTKEKKIIVLIDNLDKSWSKNSQLELQSKWILGLLGLTGRIVNDLSFANDRSKSIKFHLTIFLRSDIFNHVLMIAREPDKIERTKIKWEDPDVLFRIIEERFVSLSKEVVTPSDLWQNYIVSEINGESLKSYIFERIIPRPRDIIYLFKDAKENAVSRGHFKIEINDIETAHKNYSSWVFTSLLVENGITVKQMEEFLYEFAGSSNIVTTDDIINCMIKARINTDVDYFINNLASLSIIGREVSQGQFVFDYDFDTGKKTRALASKFNSNRYKIHNALALYLECKITYI